MDEGTGNVAGGLRIIGPIVPSGYGKEHTNEDFMNENTVRFAQAIGHSALRIWADLPRDIQECLFEDAAGADEVLRHQLALYLHDHHPCTAHPPKPTAVA
jgi:hypothetical protein